ncbi:MAG: hypothetical protein EXR62_05355 [Chloroflexi bacterium]|nr:hypothetical protein [Chloroflexota bacterium]
MNIAGTWHIYEMETWDADYFNMEVQAFLEIDAKGMGDFQFGLVTGSIDGEIIQDGTDERFEFTWDGSDESDEATGSGWLRVQPADTIQGRIKIHSGDSSQFLARRAK